LGGGALISATGPVGPGATPVLASRRSASSVGKLAVPAGWPAATPSGPAIAGRSGYDAAPRYGVKPKVMPTQLLV
jgi:hypothetical protein